MKRILSCLIVAMATATTTCGQATKTYVKWNCPPSGEPLLETITFNAGLAPGVVPHATPRTRISAQAIGKLRGAGLICLQEVWEPEARDLVLDALGLPVENVFYQKTEGEGEAFGVHRCMRGSLEPLLECVNERCQDYPDEDKSICAKKRCYLHLGKIYWRDKNCVQCLLSMVGHRTDEVRRVCTSDGGRSSMYHGSNGTILMSRWPLTNREVIRLPSSGVNRVALLATVSVPGMGEIEVGCTHLSSETIMSPIDPRFKEWSDEMLAQFQLADRRLAERAAGKPQIFLGDFNAGPSRSGYGMHWPPVHRGVALESSSPRVWAYIRRSGFTSAAVRAKPSFCTTCADNSLRGYGNHLIDHVLLRNPKEGLSFEAVCAHPWFDEPVQAVMTDGHPTSINLSDHYGTVVKFRKRPKSIQ